MPTDLPALDPAVPADHAPPTPTRRRLGNVALALFFLYVAAIYVLALDQSLHWHLFPSQAERELTAKIQQLGDASLSKAQRDDVVQDIVNWNTFSVPPLLKAIESGPPAVREPAVKCLQTIAFKYYNVDIAKYGSDPVQLKAWWSGLQADWAKAEKAQQQ